MIDYRLFRGLEKRSLTISNQFLRGLNDVEFDNYIKDVRYQRRMDRLNKVVHSYISKNLVLELNKGKSPLEQVGK